MSETPTIQESGRLKGVKLPTKYAATAVFAVLALVALIAFYHAWKEPPSISVKSVAKGAGKDDKGVDTRTPENMERQIKTEEAAKRTIEEQAAIQEQQSGDPLSRLRGTFGRQQTGGSGTGGAIPYYGYQGHPYYSHPPQTATPAVDKKAEAAKRAEEKQAAAIKASKLSRVVFSMEEKPESPPPVSRPVVHEKPLVRPVAVIQKTEESSGPKYILRRGTPIETRLTNGLYSMYTGPVKVEVTTPIYTRDRTVMLIAAGSEFLGEADRIAEAGTNRIAVTFDQLVRTDGVKVDLGEMPGLSQEGYAGIKDKVHRHIAQKVAVAAAMGALAGFSLMNTGGYYYGDGWDQYRQGLSQSMGRSGMQWMNRLNNIPDEVEIRPGHRVKVFLMKDIELPAYAN